jgi:tungstate transport system substrate-binding protein
MIEHPMGRRRRTATLLAGIAAAALLVTACSTAASPAPTAVPTEQVAPPVTAAPATAVPVTPAPTEAPSVAPIIAGSKDIILATTTSTQDSGLLDVLVPAFQEATGYNVKTVAVGSGQAMEMGAKGDADVLLVHSPAAEKEFMAAGNGVDRELVMHNTFLIVGPKDDPAGIAGMTSAADALKKIVDSGATFVSRGDGSGTEKKELGYWDKLAVKPSGDAYLQTGQGMATTLRIASEKGAYTLTDSATWGAISDQLDLEVDVQGDPSLLNIYHVIDVNPAKWPKVNADGAKAFAAYILGPEGQGIIGSFGLDASGHPLFIPDAGKAEDTLTWP